jgi:tRNA(fMet)-specific endonuclease VapC
MKLALDTNRYSDLGRDVPGVRETLEGAESIFLPFVVLAELRAGFVSGTRLRRNEDALLRFLSRPNVSVLFPDDATTHHYAAIDGQLRRQGTRIPTNDMWIAALVFQHSLTLFARDAHFDRLPQIPRI